MTTLSIADEIRRELGDSSVSAPSIAFWLVNHIGDLNNLIQSSFAISADSISISPDLGQEEKSIFKKLYNIYYYEGKIRSFLGAAANDIVLEVSSDGATVRTVNKNELSKTYVQMKKMESEDLKALLAGYAGRSVSFLQVCGDDTIGSVGRISNNRFREPNV
jgi:hypothetical protein